MSIVDNILTREYGISPELCALAEATERQVRGEFEHIDRVRDYNQLKVLRSMQKNGLAERHFNFSTGYGYNDIGRDLLDRIFADAFDCEDALVRSQFISGTHALTVALFGILRPGDTVVSVTGKPYDTLEGILGIRGAADEGSLKDFGVNYRQVDLLPDGSPDLEGIAAAVAGVKLAIMQRSRGYSSRDALSVETLGRIARAVKAASPATLVLCDNCYGEFVDIIEPVNVGADFMVGSLIKNPGGGLALTGGYIAGKAECVRKCANRLTAPGLGKHVGSSLGMTRSMVQGFYIAPHTVAKSLKGAVFTAALFEKLGYDTSPAYDAHRSDIVQTVRFRSPEKLAEFCRMIQRAAPVDSDAVPVADDMPGYEAQVIMAAGNFVQGASIELSADGPMIPPYTAFMQGGLTYVNVKLAALLAAEALNKLD
ncbi:MAG: methionine gamma-lyase family protein [Clostridia bacterium]|nr:methionine gamma-lyase family protein [Clostridia bacterium]